jgi:hypothetical protein
MSSLSARSTYNEIRAAYEDNASYLEDQSAAKARAFITACRLLIRHLPTRVSKGGNEMDLDVRLLAEQIAAAERFLTQANIAATAARPRYFSLEYFRD